MSEVNDSLDNSDDSEMMMSDGDTGAAAMAAARTDNGSPVDEDGTGDADGGKEGGQTPLSYGPLATPISDVIESSDDAGGTG
jgi:hypothetical protein